MLAGCAVVRPAKQVNDSQKQLAKKQKLVLDTLDTMESNEKQKQIQTSTLAVGIDYSLSQVTNPPVEVITAKSLNERIVSIVGSPHIEETKRIKAIVDLLNSEVSKEREKGQKLLNEKDKQIDILQKEKSALKSTYDKQLWEINDAAIDIAITADENKATLNQMSGFFGLNAVFWGLKHFFFTCLTWILVFAIIFFILRLLSKSNPIAAAAFSIFDLIGSMVIGLFKGLTPKAFEISNLSPVKEVYKFKQPLTKMVDVIEELKVKQADNPTKTYTLQEVLDYFRNEFDDKDKNLIGEILKELRWKK